MTTVFILLLVAVAVAFVLTKKSTEPLKLVGNVKKVEAAVVKTLDINNDGKVDLKDAKAAVEVVKKVRKPRAKKTTPKKKS